MKKIIVLVGTRPNFIKVTQFKLEAEKFGFDLRIVHTGQHYDYKMSGVFFEEFKLYPDHFLNLPKGISVTNQIASIIIKLEEYISNHFYPDLFLVVGDVNSTLAGAVFAHKFGIPLGHIESGLRSKDRGMPEEINRILTDQITDYCFITEKDGYNNLINEGANRDRLFFVGNTMIDTLVAFTPQIDNSSILNNLNVEEKEYALMTMHRPATVDFKEGLLKILDIIKLISKTKKIVFPLHPRTKNKFELFNLYQELVKIEGLIICPPASYFEFQKLIKEANFVITDSGGIQEETTFRKIPCLTLRPNTERPSTVESGTNTLVPFSKEIINDQIDQILNKNYKKGDVPDLWDGKATSRIFQVLKDLNI